MCEIDYWLLNFVVKNRSAFSILIKAAGCRSTFSLTSSVLSPFRLASFRSPITSPSPRPCRLTIYGPFHRALNRHSRERGKPGTKAGSPLLPPPYLSHLRLSRLTIFLLTINGPSLRSLSLPPVLSSTQSAKPAAHPLYCNETTHLATFFFPKIVTFCNMPANLSKREII